MGQFCALGLAKGEKCELGTFVVIQNYLLMSELGSKVGGGWGVVSNCESPESGGIR